MMGAGNASSTIYKTNVNLNTFGGNKKQGITSRVGLDNWANAAVQTYSNGYGRNKLFCMNQLGGVGAGKSMFNGRFTQTDGTHCLPDDTEILPVPVPVPLPLPIFNPVADEPYQLFYANWENYKKPDDKLHNFGIYNDEFITVEGLSLETGVSKSLSQYFGIQVVSTTNWGIRNIATNLTNFTNAYIEVYLDGSQSIPTITVTYNDNIYQYYSNSESYTGGSYVIFTDTCPSFLENNYPSDRKIKLSMVTGDAPSSIQSISLTIFGTTNNLRILNIGHIGNNNNYLFPCEWSGSNYTYNQTLDTKTYSTYTIRNVDLGQQLVQYYELGTTFKINDASISKFKNITNQNGLCMYGLDPLTTDLDLSFYSQGTSTALDTSKSITMFVILEVLPLVSSVTTACPEMVISSLSQTYVYSSVIFPIVPGAAPYKVLLWVGSNDDLDFYPEITQRVRLTSTDGFPTQMIKSASLRMKSTTCKSIVLLTGGISFLNASNQSITSVTAFGEVQYSLVVPIQAATNSIPQKATVRLTNIQNTNPYGNMYTQSIPLTSTSSVVVFPMISVYNAINLTVDYEYLNGPGKTTSGINNLTLLGIQLVIDGDAPYSQGTYTPNGSETFVVTSLTYNPSDKKLYINATLTNTNLNRNDGVSVLLASLDGQTIQPVGYITNTGNSIFDLTTFVGNWTTGYKLVALVPYRDEHVTTKINKINYDTTNQILTIPISN